MKIRYVGLEEASKTRTPSRSKSRSNSRTRKPPLPKYSPAKPENLPNAGGDNHEEQILQAKQLINSAMDLIKTVPSKNIESEKPHKKLDPEKRKRLEQLDKQLLLIMDRGRLLEKNYQLAKNRKKMTTPAKSIQTTRKPIENTIAEILSKQIENLPDYSLDDTLEHNEILADMLEHNVHSKIQKTNSDPHITNIPNPSNIPSPKRIKNLQNKPKTGEPIFLRVQRADIELNPGTFPSSQQTTTCVFLTINSGNNVVKTSTRCHTDTKTSFTFTKSLELSRDHPIEFCLSLRTYRDRQAKPIARGMITTENLSVDSIPLYDKMTKVTKSRKLFQKSRQIGVLYPFFVTGRNEANILQELQTNTAKKRKKKIALQEVELDRNQLLETPPEPIVYATVIATQARNLPNIASQIDNIRTFSSPSSYLVIRSAIFTSVDKSYVTETVHDSIHPEYNCRLMWPMQVNYKTIMLYRNNLIIVEIWAQQSNGNKLLGLVKVPTHQWFLSLENEQISKHVLQSPYPLVAVNGWLPIVNVFTGENIGELRLAVALGTDAQLENFTETGKKRHEETIKTRVKDSVEKPIQNSPDKLNQVKVLHSYDIGIVSLINLNLCEWISSLICDGTSIFIEYRFVDTNKNSIGLNSFRSNSISFDSSESRQLFNDTSRFLHEFSSDTLGQANDLTEIFGVHFKEGTLRFNLWSVQLESISETNVLLAYGEVGVSDLIHPFDRKEVLLPMKSVEGEELDAELKVEIRYSVEQINPGEMKENMLKNIPNVTLSFRLLKG